MPAEAIEKVKAAEEEAKSIRKSASDKAKEIVAAQKKLGESSVESALRLGEQKFNDTMYETEAKCEKIISDEKNSALANAQKIRDGSQSRMDGAVEIILRKAGALWR